MDQQPSTILEEPVRDALRLSRDLRRAVSKLDNSASIWTLMRALIEFEEQVPVAGHNGIERLHDDQASPTGQTRSLPANDPPGPSVDLGPKPEILKIGAKEFKPPSSLVMLWKLGQTPTEFVPAFEFINDAIATLNMSKTGADKMRSVLLASGHIEQMRNRFRITAKGFERFTEEKALWDDQKAQRIAENGKSGTAPA